jgi:type IV secretion system protein VirB3
MSERNAGLTADSLFVGVTRPPMRWGVTYSALLFNLVFTMEVFLLSKNLLTLLIALPIHGLCALLCARDARFFDLILLWGAYPPARLSGKSSSLAGEQLLPDRSRTPGHPGPPACRPGLHMPAVTRQRAIKREQSAERCIPYTAQVAEHVVRLDSGDYVQVFRLGGASFESADDWNSTTGTSDSTCCGGTSPVPTSRFGRT